MNTDIRNTRVDATAVAKHLGIDRTTVYALLKGVRGWSRIEPLPHFVKQRAAAARNKHGKKDWFEFDLTQIDEWKERTGFSASNSGRRLKPAVAEAIA